jgi:predicted amidohydrolase YtcJ
MLATQHPFDPREAISREQAVRAYTLGSAYAEFAEKDQGVLAAGMLTDFAVLTLVGGKVVYDAKLLGAKP